jgi:hypothetical protein
MNPILKAALIAVAVPVYLIAGLYLSVGIGEMTHNPNNTTFAAFVVIVVGVMALVRATRRRRDLGRA